MLTYNGEQAWSPRHGDDAEMTAAFHVHQRNDKGFGAAAGPSAPVELARAFAAAGHRVEEGDSPWILAVGQRRDETARRDEQRLIDDLAGGYATAVRETFRPALERLSASAAREGWNAGLACARWRAMLLVSMGWR